MPFLQLNKGYAFVCHSVTAVFRTAAGTVDKCCKSTKFTSMMRHEGVNGSKDSVLKMFETLMSPVVLIQ